MVEVTNWKVYDLKESVIACRNAMRLAPPEYTDEELDEIGRLKGKYLGLQTKHTIENIEKRATDFGKQLDGVIEGFSDVFSQDDQD